MRLKELLNPVKQSLAIVDVDVRSENININDVYIQVNFFTPQKKDLLKMKIDMRDLGSREQLLKERLFNLLYYIHSNFLDLSAKEVEFLTELRDATDQMKFFRGPADDFFVSLEETGAIELQRVEDGWFAALTKRGAIILSDLESIYL